MTNPNRVPSGVSTGGQFAPDAKAESEISLAAKPVDPQSGRPLNFSFASSGEIMNGSYDLTVPAALGPAIATHFDEANSDPTMVGEDPDRRAFLAMEQAGVQFPGGSWAPFGTSEETEAEIVSWIEANRDPAAAATVHPEPAVPEPRRANLDAVLNTNFSDAMSDLHSAEELGVFADSVQAKYPGALSFQATSVGNGMDSEVWVRMANGDDLPMASTDNHDPGFYGDENNLYLNIADDDGWVGFSGVNLERDSARARAAQETQLMVTRYAADNDQRLIQSDDLSTIHNAVELHRQELAERAEDDAYEDDGVQIELEGFSAAADRIWS
ncbi:hypothetical protein LG293_17440 (plasmid) [Citricoccus nitrophenolicus]